MATENYRQTYSWTAAMQLGRTLTRVVEQLPVDERPALGLQLQTALTELPVAIGQDLVLGGQSRQAALVRLYGLLDLIETIYPALDLAPATTALDELNDRLLGDHFNEVIVPPPVVEKEEEPEEEVPAAPEAEPPADEELPTRV